MRKVFALFMAAACILGAAVLSKPKAGTTGGVKAEVFLVSPTSGLNFASAFVCFSGNTSLVDVSCSINRYKDKLYRNCSAHAGQNSVVLKSDYSHSWHLSGDGANSMDSNVSYSGGVGSKSDEARKTF
ncbi:MAG: hypothetical protein IKX68_09490 [Clostridiales bacterium]|nr:hypothetical protein [Clostridiales bacterium]